MDLSNLQKIGLSNGEIKIYSMLLESGAAPLNKIHESTGIERRNIYDILNKLIERGLVVYINENKRRVFKTSHPSNIIKYIEEKENSLEAVKEELNEQLPPLLKQFNLRKQNIDAEIYRGEEGMKALFEDLLNAKDLYWIGGARYMPKMYPAWTAGWTKRRIKQGVRVHYLAKEEMRGEMKPYGLEEIKFLPNELSESPTVIGISGDKVHNLLFGKELFAFVIENKETAEGYKAYFKYLWDNVAKK
ncbi:MAG: helix-turn-helix domain-containing protein [archaeon]